MSTGYAKNRKPPEPYKQKSFQELYHLKLIKLLRGSVHARISNGI